MAHEIESMFYTGATPWHGLGVTLPAAPTIAAAMIAAGLDWRVALKKLVLAEDTATCDSLDDCREISTRAVVRESDGKVLGTVGPDYEPLQNTDAFAFFQPFLDSGAAVLETAGSLRGGRKVWVLANVSAGMLDVLPGDSIRNYFMLSNSHDGSMSVRVGRTDIRIVCANTLASAIGDRRSQLLRIRHTRNVADALTEVQRVTQMAQQSFAATIEQYRTLARKGVNVADMRKFVKAVFAQPKQAPIVVPAIEVVDETDKAGERVADRVMELIESGRGTDVRGVRGTLWGAYNAVTEYLSHDRGTDSDRRLDSLWFGNGATLNAKALDLALQMAR